MNSGIYALYWWDQDLVYIGLTVNLIARKDQHLRLLKREAHYNYKLQQTYNLYGEPEYIVIEKVSQGNLSEAEIYWGREFDCLGSKGLNISDLGIQGAYTSKYTRLILLRVFRELYLTPNTFKSIGNKYSVTPEFAINIFYSKNHLWLREKYPKQYLWMQNNIRKDNSFQHKLRKTSSMLLSPDGTVHECTIIKQFARTHNLISSNLNQVILGNRSSHKGWKIYEEA